MPISVRARDGVRGDAVKSDGGQEQRERAEEPRQQRHDPLLDESGIDLLFQWREGDRDVWVDTCDCGGHAAHERCWRPVSRAHAQGYEGE